MRSAPGAAIGIAHNMMGFAPERARDLFDRALVGVAGSFYNRTLLVTENGIADGADTKRAAFLESHVAVLAEAEAEGLPVHGYLHWSLVDNYEWLDGWEPRFGILELDRKTLARRERPSAQTFRRLASAYLGPASVRGGR